jgi:hypothetical protein
MSSSWSHHLDIQRLEAAGELEADGPGSRDHHVAPPIGLDTDEREHVREVISGDREVDQVAYLDHLFAVGDEPVVPSMNRHGERRRGREQEIHVGDAHPREVGARPDAEAGHQQLALHEGDDINRTLDCEQRRDPVDGGLLGIHTDVPVGVLAADQRERLRMVGIVQADDDPVDVEQ